MKRYKTQNIDFDTRPNILKMKIEDHWEDKVKALNSKNQEIVRDGYKQQFGLMSYEQKEQNILDVGAMFPSIIAFHNKFLTQARNSFIIGSYYPSLTAITTLTERVLNHLIILLRDDFKNTPEYKKVYNKDSFTDWDMLIDTLTSRGVLLPETKQYLLKLKKLRHEYAAHFNSETDSRDRELALEALEAFQEFTRIQFGFLGKQPWFIPGTKGSFFIKKEYEDNPFIKKVYIPNCVLVGPNFKLETVNRGLKVVDEEYEDQEITDEEFVELLEKDK